MIMWFTVVFILILLLCAGVLIPSWFDMDKEEKPQLSRRSYKWDGPKTDVRINQMLAECITLMKDLGVPVSDSICPEVKLMGSRCRLASCYPKGSVKRYNEYDYYIEISGHILNNSEKSLRNTLIHELLHTVPNGMCHTGEWKKWAKYVSDKTEYKIKRLADFEME